MTTKRYRIWKQCIAGTVTFVMLFLLFFTQISFAFTSTDMDKTEPVKVGWFIAPGFQDIDENGNCCGFSYDYLQEMTRFTGLQFEYVVGGFGDLLQQLKDGEIDMMMAIEYEPERTEFMDFTSYPICPSNTVITTLEKNAKDFQDMQSLQGASVGMLAGTRTIADFEELLRIENVTVDLKEYTSAQEMVSALYNGEVQYLVENQMRAHRDDEMILGQVKDCMENIAVNKNRDGLLDALNSGIRSISDTEPDYVSNLYSKYFQMTYARSFLMTSSEKEAIQELGTFRVVIDANETAFYSNENGELSGPWVEVSKKVAELLGIPCEITLSEDAMDTSVLNQEDTPDFIVGFNYDYNWAEENEVQICDQFLNYQYYRIVNKNTYTDDASAVVAGIKHGYLTNTFFKEDYADNQLVLYQTPEQCVSAVNAGKADITYLNSYLVEQFMSGYLYNNIQMQLSDQRSLYCFAAASYIEPAAIAAVNKAICAIDDAEIDRIMLDRETEIKSNANRARMLFYSNPGLVMGVIVVAVSLVTAVIILLIMVKRIRKEKIHAEQASKAKGEFLSRVTHDLRTPMNGIVGMTQVMRNHGGWPKEMNDYFDQIDSSSNYLLGLINDVLDMSAIERGKLVIQERPVNLRRAAEHILMMVRPIADRQEVELVTDFVGIDDVTASVDEMRFDQIYVNLLSNALKFSQPGEKVVFSMQCTEFWDGHARLVSYVEDHGCGMSEEFQKRMFDAFEQAQDSRVETQMKQGTGLGLAIVKDLSEIMDLEVEVESQLNVGTKITVSGIMDLMEVEEELPKKPKEEVENISFHGKRVLVCEDNAVNMEIAKLMLEEQGFTVLRAENGQDGLDIFRASEVGAIDLILMDIRMPILDGLEAARRIRGLDREDAKQVPIIALSANAYDTDVEASLAAGMNAHLSKPVDWKKVFETASEVIISK